MKKYISLFSFFSFILFSCLAFASTATMTTYYPAPTAAYNTVSLSPTYVQTNPTNGNGSCPNCGATPACCGANNVGMIYKCTFNVDFDPPPPQLMACQGPNSSSPWCSPWDNNVNLENGMVVADGTGTLNVCMDGSPSYNPQVFIYPQQCYNASCSFTSPYCTVSPPTADAPCPCNPQVAYPASPLNTYAQVCAPGYSQVWLYSGAARFPGDIGGSDLLQTSSTNYTLSYACCPSTIFTPGTDTCAYVNVMGGGPSGWQLQGHYGDVFCVNFISATSPHGIQELCTPSGWKQLMACPP